MADLRDSRSVMSRRWVLYDQSEDYHPRWKVGADSSPPASEYAEAVEVMPVAEHEAKIKVLQGAAEALLTANYVASSWREIDEAQTRLRQALDG